MNGSTARESILSSIRDNLTASRPFDHVHGEHHQNSPEPATRSVRSEMLKRDLIAMFRQNFETVGGRFVEASSIEDASDKAADLIRERQARRVAVSDSPIVGSVIGSLDGVEFVQNGVKADLLDCDLGVTAAQFAIAETGTLVLESNAERHRLVSLVPPIHICVLKTESIRQTMGEVLELTARDLSRVVTFITGASRTSDIELTLAIGVHGPGELIVIVIND